MNDDTIVFVSTPSSKEGFFSNVIQNEVQATRNYVTSLLAKEYYARLKRLLAFIEEPVLP